jgi:hypothetical protein
MVELSHGIPVLTRKKQVQRVVDPCDYRFKLLQRDPTPERICLQVGNIDRANLKLQIVFFPLC